VFTKDEKRMNEIAYVDGDDWVGLYINRKLVSEGHQITLQEFCELCKIKIKFYEADNEWLGKRGHFPQKLGEVVVVS
jgi:hypothetical protein